MAANPLTLAVGQAKPPYIEGNGKTGLEVALSSAALTLGDIPVRIEQMPQARARQSLEQGSIDIMLSTTPGLVAGRCYSAPLLHYRNRAITLESRKLEITQVRDLSPYA